MEPSAQSQHEADKHAGAAASQLEQSEPDAPSESMVVLFGEQRRQPDAVETVQAEFNKVGPETNQDIDRHRVNAILEGGLDITPGWNLLGERHDSMGRDYKGIDPSELTARGTPRIRRPKRSREELDGDPHAEANMFEVKLGARIPRELRDEFVAATKKNGMTQTIALTQAIEEYLDRLELP